MARAALDLELQRGDPFLDLDQFVLKAFRLVECRVGVHHRVALVLVEKCRIVKLEVVDCGQLDLIKPLNSLAVLPKSMLRFVVLRNDVSADAVLLAFVPVALIAAAISPGVDTEPMLFIIFVLTLVHATIVPDVNAHSFHVVLVPFTFVTTTVQP